jgi:hypothetical protein
MEPRGARTYAFSIGLPDATSVRMRCATQIRCPAALVRRKPIERLVDTHP